MFRFLASCRGMTMVTIILFLASFPGYASHLPQLRVGSRGPETILLQHYLHQLGYFQGSVDGIFGAQTQAAVMRFQSENGLVVDGIVGRETWSLLRKEMTTQPESIIVRQGDTLWDLARKYRVSVNELAKINGVTEPNRLRVGQKLVLPSQGARAATAATAAGTVAGRPSELVLWSEANEIFPRGGIAEVLDVETGLTFRVKRCYGHYHADVEPLTRQDTETIKRLYGGNFSWNRRAVIVSINGRNLAASMNGFPHGNSTIQGNGFPGHFCIHFLGSRLHLDGTIHRSHQEMVLRAAGYTPSSLWFAGDRTR